jgi:hypothetical protein
MFASVLYSRYELFLAARHLIYVNMILPVAMIRIGVENIYPIDCLKFIIFVCLHMSISL